MYEVVVFGSLVRWWVGGYRGTQEERWQAREERAAQQDSSSDWGDWKPEGVFKEESPPPTPTPPPTPKSPFNVFGSREEENADEEEKADEEGGVVIVETPGRLVVVIVIAEISVPASQPHLSPARTSALLPKALGGPSCFILSRV